MDETALQEKLRKIEARLAELRGHEPDVELVYTLGDPWTRKLFVALCRRYGLKPFRRYRQRYTTVRVVAPESFQNGVLWPEFVALSDALEKHLSDITDRVVREAIHGDVSEAAEGDGPKALPESSSG